MAPVPAITSYAKWQKFIFKAAHANTGASTLNVNGKGAIAIKKGVNQDLVAGDIPANAMVGVLHDGTNFHLVSSLDLTTLLTAKGQMLYASAVGTPAMLNPGTDSQIIGLVYC